MSKSKGNYNAGAGAVIYTDCGAFLELRQVWEPDGCKGDKNGIKQLTPLAQILILPDAVQMDCMHTVYGGIFKWMLAAMYKRSGETYVVYLTVFMKSILFTREDWFKNLEVRFFRPKEIKRRIRPFKDMATFKTNELKTVGLFQKY